MACCAPPQLRASPEPSPIELRYVTEKNPCTRGRKSEGEQPLSNAERQARYRRGSRPTGPRPSSATSVQADRRTRAHVGMTPSPGCLALQAEYAAWYDNLPDSLRDTATAAALQAIVDLDLDELAAIVPPRGYGRD